VALDDTSSEALLAQAADAAAKECGSYRFRHWLRSSIVCDADIACYGLQLEENWQELSDAEPVVILVHGFNSTAARNRALLEPIRAAGIPCGSFSYPNDHTILASAQLLASELRQFGKLHPDRRVVLVCHSMGGMVARACLENPYYDPGNVDRLILIAPPTHGSLLAHFAVGSDLWEHWLSRRSGGPWRRMRDSVIDGLGEAADDLCTDSEFLENLNERPRNPRVEYTVILGTGAVLSDAQLDWIRESVRESLARLPGVDASAQRIDALLADIDELVAGKGDGVVAVKRGRLKGVSDTLVMPFGHIAVTGEPKDDTVRRVHDVVLRRIH
jgi:pimeloyl-ACP methyl ester carboxylesterase